MNILFGVLISLFWLIPFWLLMYLTPKAWWAKAPLLLEIRKPFVVSVSVISIVFSAYSSLQTYGPRHELRQMSLPAAPQSVEVEEAKDWIEHKDRIGQFDERLKDAP